MEVGIIVLAAGASARLGTPKQLLHYGGKTLLQNAVEQACASNASITVVVLGARAELLQSSIDGLGALVVVNAAWEQGMASSIKCGLNALLQKSPAMEGVILMVCDQPYVTAGLLNQLIAAYRRSGEMIVTCSYGDTFGPPSFFHKSLFAELVQLTGDTGARGVVKQHANDVAVVPFPEGSIDIDTAADYSRLQQSERGS